MNRMIDLILTIVSKNAKEERIVTKANIHNFLALAFFFLLSSDCVCVCVCMYMFQMCIAHSCIHFCSIDRTEQTSSLTLPFARPSYK